jgi:hypothetical protein
VEIAVDRGYEVLRGVVPRDAVEAALRQSADVVRLRHEQLGAQGPVAALLRF